MPKRRNPIDPSKDNLAYIETLFHVDGKAKSPHMYPDDDDDFDIDDDMLDEE